MLPRNHVTREAIPCFVDEGGRPCAVAHLLVEDGASSLTARVVRDANHAYLATMEVAGLAEWIATSGLTAEELAWIQPTYAPDPCAATCVVCAEPVHGTYDWDGATLSAGPRELDERGVAFVVDGQILHGGMPPRRWTESGWVEEPKSRAFAQGKDLWTVDTQLRRTTGSVVTAWPIPPDSGRDRWTGAWGSGTTTWFVGGASAVRRQGDEVVVVARPGGFASVTGSSERDVWLVGDPLLHWDGENLEKIEVSLGVDLARASASAVPGELWLGGSSIVVARGTECTRYALGGGLLVAFAAASPSNAVVSYFEEAIFHGPERVGRYAWNGQSWHEMAGPAFDAAYAVEGGKIRLVAALGGMCATTRVDGDCVARREAACASAGRKHEDMVARPLPPPRLVERFACPRVTTTLAMTKLAPLPPKEPAIVASRRPATWTLVAGTLVVVGLCGAGILAARASRVRRP